VVVCDEVASESCIKMTCSSSRRRKLAAALLPIMQ